MTPTILAEYTRWREKAELDTDLKKELARIERDITAIEDAFYCDLAFGTGGLRGLLGAGTNRMNVYTVAKASQGLADYLCHSLEKNSCSIAIGYDSRIKSDLFARTAAGVFAANGITVWMYPQLMPTPCLSFAVRRLSCSAGVMITASHNPAVYNGYKVYGADGCQITMQAAAEILKEIEKLDVFADVQHGDFDALLAQGAIRYIAESVEIDFLGEVKCQSLLKGAESINRSMPIVYSPLNGTGREPVVRILRETGFTNVTVVKEQNPPDGNFPTCPYPNPELPEAMQLGIRTAKVCGAELFLATDPDCDRVGIAVQDEKGNYILLSGNQTGCLLLDYICARRIENGRMPGEPVFIKTIVTTELARRIATHYGVKTIETLTGFKYIGEQIGQMEAESRVDSFVLGFEESCGYLTGSYVRDKDAVNAVLQICEMFAFYKAKGVRLTDRLQELYKTYGYTLDTLHGYAFEGSQGIAKMQGIMARLREKTPEIAGHRVEQCLDYALGADGLPCADVLKFHLAGGCIAVVRPSGTEPKMKLYLSISASDEAAARAMERCIEAAFKEVFAETASHDIC